MIEFKAGWSFRAEWSETDREWIGLCDRYPSLSYMAATKEEALSGIDKLVTDIIIREIMDQDRELLSDPRMDDGWQRE